MDRRRVLGAGIAVLSLSAVGLTMGAGVASASTIKPPACATQGAGGIAVAAAHGAPLSCTNGLALGDPHEW